jgi:hypothetical protein
MSDTFLATVPGCAQFLVIPDDPMKSYDEKLILGSSVTNPKNKKDKGPAWEPRASNKFEDKRVLWKGDHPITYTYYEEDSARKMAKWIAKHNIEAEVHIRLQLQQVCQFILEHGSVHNQGDRTKGCYNFIKGKER